MRENSRPTRAEVTDIATAIYTAVDALMLTGETASGKYPIEAVKTLKKVAYNTEKSIDYKHFKDKIDVDKGEISEGISYAAIDVADEVKAKGIITFTTSGSTALRVAKFRPSVPIYAITPDRQVCAVLSAIFGTYPIKTGFFATTDEMIESIKKIIVDNNIGKAGDRFVITAGVPVGVVGNTNMLKVVEI